MKRALLAIGLLGFAATTAQAATGVTVFLDRNGMVLDRNWDDSLEDIAIPRFGGSARVWAGVVSCVREKFAAFDVEVVDEQPPSGEFITALVGGRAEQLGFDGEHVAGVGVSDVVVTRDAIVHVFSQSVGERDAKQLCEVAAHELGHAMGLDHSMQCGDLMSYPREECGFGRVETFTDADAPCGEYEDRACNTGADTQNSFQRLARLVGLRAPVEPDPDDEGETGPEPEENPFIPAQEPEPNPVTPAPEPQTEEEPVVEPHSCMRQQQQRRRHRARRR